MIPRGQRPQQGVVPVEDHASAGAQALEDLKLGAEDALDLEQIEKRAKELGMRQPGSSQIIYVQVDADDTTEVYAAPAEKNVFVRVIDAFRSAFTDAINYFS